jgi:hypothetical protein
MTSEQRGIKMTIDGTSNWNGQTMERTELIPQTSSNIGTGNLFYHFSVKHSSTNPPDVCRLKRWNKSLNSNIFVRSRPLSIRFASSKAISPRYILFLF